MAYEKLDKNIRLITHSYTTLTVQGSTTAQETITEQLIEGYGMVGYDPDVDGDVRIPSGFPSSEVQLWDINFIEGDLDVVDSLDSLVSATVLAVLTMLDELDYIPYRRFGTLVWNEIYERLDALALRRIEDEIRKALERMDRIEEVIHISAEQIDKERVYVDVAVRSITDEEERFSLTVG